MRLGTCVALELVCALGTAAGVWIVAGHGLELAGDVLQPEAAAATTPPPNPVTRLPSARLEVGTPVGDTTVFEQPDDALLAPLAATRVTAVKVNRGGTSLSLRVDFASGARAAFKPQQIHPQSDPRREIAAYRIDRLLGVGHVAPAMSATFAVADLVAAAPEDAREYTAQRLANEAIAHGGAVSGEVSWWIPEIRDAMIGAHRLDEPLGMAEWVPYLQAADPAGDAEPALPIATPPELVDEMAQLSTMIVFDVVIDNADRWSGNNTKCAPDQRTLYFMDNTLSFSLFTFGHEANLRPLHAISKFSAKLVTRLRMLTYATVERAVTSPDDPLAPILLPAEIHALLARRDHVLRYIDDLRAELGDGAVLAYP